MGREWYKLRKYIVHVHTYTYVHLGDLVNLDT